MAQNSADSPPDNSSAKNLPTVVNDHADQLMDELFADIEDLLSGDLHEQKKALAATDHPISKPLTPDPPISPLQEPGYIPPPPIDTPAAVYVAPPAKSGIWKKVLVGLGITVIAASGGLWWLTKTGKLKAPDLSGTVSNADVKFSDYLHRALNKVETASPTINPSSIPASSAANPVTLPAPPGAALAPEAAPAPSVGSNASAQNSFTKIIASNPPTVEFLIAGQVQQVKPGEAIGQTGWTLSNVINTVDNEVIIKRNGELRSLKAGQQF